MTRYLISRGHRKIGVIAGTPITCILRRDAWGTRALYEDGILYNPDWIRYGTGKGVGYQGCGQLLNEALLPYSA